MSPDMKRLTAAEVAIHERARMLAAESVDAKVESSDADWLAGHLASCADCTAIAAEYQDIHTELRSLQMPEVPRDLWARTSAALDAVDAGASKKSSAGQAPRAGRRPMFGTAVAVGFVVVAAGASLLSQSPIIHPGSAPTSGGNVARASGTQAGSQDEAQAPLAIVKGQSIWMDNEVTGRYDIKGGTTTCSTSDGSCVVAGGTGQTLGSINSDTPVSAVIAPDADRAAVWTGDKIVIMPLSAKPQTVDVNLLTPRPTAVAASRAAATLTATAASTAAPITSAPAATSAASASPSATVAPTPAPTPAPTASASASAAISAQPTAILSGYEIVGRGLEFSADGNSVAFSARPTDGSSGPDVFIWHVGQERAAAVTHRHADMFAGWYGRQIILSEIASASTSTSYVFDPETGSVGQIDRPMLLPTVDPTGRYLIYWSGTVEFDQASGLWQPGKGDLYFDTWADLHLIPATLEPVASPSATPTPTPTPTPTLPVTPSPATPTPVPATPTPTEAVNATAAPLATVTASATSAAAQSQAPSRPTLPQVLPVAATAGAVQNWVVRWDDAGRHVAIWVADPSSEKIGRLSLFSVDDATGFVDTNEPLLGAAKVMSTISFDDANHLVYTSAVDGKTYMQSVPAVPPSSVSTPAPTTPGQRSSAGASGSPAPDATNRPGN
jgi:hypothetical protein